MRTVESKPGCRVSWPWRAAKPITAFAISHAALRLAGPRRHCAGALAGGGAGACGRGRRAVRAGICATGHAATAVGSAPALGNDARTAPPSTVQGVWFARAMGPQVRLYHAVVYTAKPRPDVADAFFAGLTLR